MAFWNATQIITINDGTTPNDGTGDPIRDAFIKVNENFSNVSVFLAQPSIDFLYANVGQNLFATYLTANNSFFANATGTVANFTSNITANNFIANSGIYNSGVSITQGNTYVGNITVSGNPKFTGGNILVSTNIIPTANLTYDLGSPTYFFRNIYAQGVVNVNTVSASSDAGLLELHANLAPGDVKDVGIFGKYYNTATSSNAFAFFGFQDLTQNFVYKQTTTDATLGNSVVYDGVYGNTQFGSQFLSNATNSTSTNTGALIVAGGAGVAGNVYANHFYGNITTAQANITNASVSGNILGNLSVTGTIFSDGYPVITTNTPGIQLYTGTTVFSGNVSMTATTPSYSPSTGALIVNYGGVGVGGTINAGGNIASSTGLVGPLYGTVMTSAQPNITSLGTLTSLNAGSISATGIGVTNLTATGSVNFSGATLSNLPALTVTGNITAGNVSAYQITGQLQGTVIQPIQTSITSVGTLTSLSVSGNTAINSSLYANSLYDSGSRVLSSVSIVAGSGLSGGGTISGPSGSVTLVNAGVTSATAGTGITLNQSTGTIIITNTGIISAAAGSGITVSGTNPLTITNTGVLSLTAGANIRLSANTGSITIDSVSGTSTTIAAGTGISVNQPTGLVTITNTGVTSLVAGTDISVSSATGAVTVNDTSTLQSVTGRGATTSNPVTFTGQVNIGADIIPTANSTYNIGSTTAWFNQFYGVATHAYYADLAERYVADSDYTPGTVVVFGGTEEITVTAQFADARVAGAISTDPAYLMNAMSPGLPVALRGKIPVQVVGPVNKGDSLVTAGNMPGYAVSVGTNTAYGQAVFAKSLTTDLSDGVKIIIAVIL